MSRLSRYRRGSIVPHLIALLLLLAGSTLGGAIGDDSSRGMLAAQAAVPARDGGVDGEVDEWIAKPAAPDTAAPGARTFLAPNRPNPFTESTTIEFSLATTMVVSLKVYDFWYNEVETLIDGQELGPGPHLARFTVRATEDHPIVFSGMYFYELRAGGEIHQRRMLVIK